MRGCSLPLPVPDATGRYCGSPLPTVRGGMADVNQVPSLVGAVVVREMCHFSTSAGPSHGLFQPGWRWRIPREAKLAEGPDLVELDQTLLSLRLAPPGSHG